ncbi:hypothetical protein [Rhizobium sp. SG2393]|uniref:hypothetical protein n=1 Tax=Rhizobium sp. SG2393 TaxID=3276279 RepID=UPI00366A6C04
MWKFVLSIACMVLLGTCVTANAGARPASADPPRRCTDFLVKPIDKDYRGKRNFNAELLAASFGIYAAASEDAYANNDQQFLFLPSRNPSNLGWKRLEWQPKSALPHRYSNSLTGLSFDTYYQAIRKCLYVMVAARGTDGPSAINDWLTNFSIIPPFLPFNQYKEIETQFHLLKEHIKARYPSYDVQFIATGHSLGGGLAIHLAKCFNDVSAVTFDTSFVHNDLLCKKRNPSVVQIYEKQEAIEVVRTILGRSQQKHENDAKLSTYGINPISGKTGPIDQHSMRKLATGMLRLALMCARENARDCEILKDLGPIGDKVAYQLYCVNYRTSLKLRGSRLAHDEACDPL